LVGLHDPLHLLQRIFDRGDMLLFRRLGSQRRAFAFDNPARAQELEGPRGRLHFSVVAVSGAEDVNTRADAHFDQPFDFESDQCLAHRRPGHAELPRQIALGRKPLPRRVFARADKRADLVGDLPIQPAGLDTLDGHGRKPRRVRRRVCGGSLHDIVAKQHRPIWSSGLTNFAARCVKISALHDERHRLSDRLAGKLALITAAGQGIGRAAALAMAKEGASVWATDVKPELLEQYRGVANVSTRVLDVLDDAAVRQAIDALPPLDVLFNCAGYVHHGTVLDCTPKDWAKSFDLNVRAMYITIQCALPRMLEHCAKTGGSASIINMASVAGSLKGIPNRFAYGASKAAVVGLTKAVAADFVAKGIRCNAIAPGTVDTPSLHERINAFPDPVEARRNFIARQPMGRLATPEEIAPVVVFLASDESAFATGTVYSVDGGMTI